MKASTKTIAIVTPNLFDAHGGVSTVAEFIYIAIAGAPGFEPHLISVATSVKDVSSVRMLSPRSWEGGVRMHKGTWHGKAFVHVGCWLSEFEFQRYMPRRALTDLLNQYDLIQVVSGTPAAAYVAKDVKKPICVQAATTARLERKTVLAQASILRKLYGFLMLPIVNHIEKEAIKRVDHIFADTDYTRKAFLPYTTNSKITIDTIGVDTQRFQPIPEEQRANDYILSVGRLADARKNVGMLFEAYARLRQRVPGAPRLVLAGMTVPPPAAWARAKELGITDHIEVKTGVSSEELVALYQQAAFFVLSSDEEGLGIVLLEAMACATPVVSTRCGGPDSVVSEDVGLLTPVGDAEAMAEKMLWMWQNPEQRRQMGQAGRRMVETRFSNEVVGKKYLDVYNRLLGD